MVVEPEAWVSNIAALFCMCDTFSLKSGEALINPTEQSKFQGLCGQQAIGRLLYPTQRRHVFDTAVSCLCPPEGISVEKEEGGEGEEE